MAKDPKEEQFIFEFTDAEGPEKPALEAEDDSLLDLEEGSAPYSPDADEEDSWEPVHIEEAVEVQAVAAEEAPAPEAVPAPVPVPASETPAEAAAAESVPAPEEPAKASEPESVPAPLEKPAPAVAETPAEVAVAVPLAVESVAVAAAAVAAAPVEAQKKEQEPEIVVIEKRAPKAKALKPADIRRAALAWMAKQKPMALAATVPTRLRRFCASVAAFWSEPGRKKRLLKPHRTAIIEIRADRAACFAESVKNAGLLPAYREAKARKIALEAEIRIKEPALKDCDFLFPDIESWNYASSANKEYRQLLKRLEELDKALHKGSRFERIRQAHVANELYLAVPEGAVAPEELAEGWGLIYVTPELDAKLVRPAEPKECPEDNMMHLAQNIGASALRDVLFSNGVYLAADGSVSVTKPPRRRRPLK